MTDRVDFDRPEDAFYDRVRLRHEVRLPVLGHRVRYRSNAAAVIRATERAFESWRVLERHPELVDGRAVDIRLVVHEGDEGGQVHAEVQHRVVDRHRLFFRTAGSMAFADPERREAVGFVTPAFVSDREHFRHAFVEGITLALVTPLDRQPFHAAALERRGAALLLAGPSGTGKSTLAYAAARAGARVLTEDTVFLQSRPTLRIWGLPGHLHLPPGAARRFPELADEPVTLLASGKRKVAVDLASRGLVPTLPTVDRAAVCVVVRNGRDDGVTRLDAAALLARLTAGSEPGFDLFSDTIGEPLALLTAGGGWLLRLSDDPADSVPRVLDLLDRVAEGAD